jgi:hypothetical protein
MKKFAIACAILMAGLFCSCADTNFCYELTIKGKYKSSDGTYTTKETELYLWTTENELIAEIDLYKDKYARDWSMPKDKIDITYIVTGDSMDDCESKNI